MNSKVIVESGSNYVKFGNGLLIEWGIGSNVITFPKPFANTTYCIALGRGGNSYEWVPSYRDKTTTRFNGQCSDKSWVWHTVEINYIAIGVAG